MTENMDDRLDNEFGKFPRYLNLVPDVLSFSYDESLKLVERLRNNTDLTRALETFRTFVANSELSEDLKEELLKLIREEEEVMTYAVISRNCVVSI